MDFRVGGLSCVGSAPDESPDIGAIRCCFRFLNIYIFAPQSARTSSQFTGKGSYFAGNDDEHINQVLSQLTSDTDGDFASANEGSTASEDDFSAKLLIRFSLSWCDGGVTYDLWRQQDNIAIEQVLGQILTYTSGDFSAVCYRVWRQRDLSYRHVLLNTNRRLSSCVEITSFRRRFLSTTRTSHYNSLVQDLEPGSS